jgi:CheY-like chemotaxis protein
MAPHILIADDNATNLTIAQMLCQMFGCTYAAAENGALALELARAVPFDLILMDIKMPVMDGLEATRHIRRLPGANAAIPIIALTANASPNDVQVYLANGMDAVVAKPIKPDALWDQMKSLLAAPRPSAAASVNEAC